MAQAVSGGGEAAPVWKGMAMSPCFCIFFQDHQSMQTAKSRPVCPASKEEGVGGGFSDEAATRLCCICTHSRVPSFPSSVPGHSHCKAPLFFPETATVLGAPWHRSSKYRHCQPALADFLKIAQMQDEIAQKILCGFDFLPDRVPVRDKQDKCEILRQKVPPLNFLLPPEIPPQPPHNPPPPPHLQTWEIEKKVNMLAFQFSDNPLSTLPTPRRLQ